MNNENKYQFINNLPKEYHRILWNIMLKAECNYFVKEPERLSKQECKLIMRFLYKMFDKIKELEQENKQLKEELENKIDLYEDTISYQLGFDKGKEYLQQKIDKAIEHIKKYQYWNGDNFNCLHCEELLEILGDKE